MLSLRIVRGPLQETENEIILTQYNRLTNSRIPMNEFVRWIQHGPEGPAWHALLETEDGSIVGHTSMIPLKTRQNSATMTPCKSEYSFIGEEFRASKIRGFEKSARPKFLTLVDQMIRHCAGEGWGPFLISTTPMLHRLGPRLGCHPVEFPVWECLLILKPRDAARKTPNMNSRQRAGLFAAGVLQRGLAAILAVLKQNSRDTERVAVGGTLTRNGSERISFFHDQASLRWRYLEDQYFQIEVKGGEPAFVVVKRGGPDSYLRVCQYELGPENLKLPILGALIREAMRDGALGVRWAFYGDTPETQRAVRQMRKHGFLCARRDRTLLINSANPELLSASKWELCDSLFSFDP
ncbi:MAG TPA: hypothetical protein VGD60_14630 [Candidatus Acidoferrales bacterium]